MTPRDIIGAVATAAGTTPMRLRDTGRHEFSKCRYVAMYLICQRCPDLKQVEVAAACGHKSNNPVGRAKAFMVTATRERAPAAALLDLAERIIDKKTDRGACVPIRIWRRKRGAYARKRVPQPVRKLPGSPPGWLLPEKRVAALYNKRNYRGPVRAERRLGA